MKIELTAPDIHCQKCAGRVREALNKHGGVRQIDVDPPTHRVQVEFDESRVSPEQIRATLTEAGYPPNT